MGDNKGGILQGNLSLYVAEVLGTFLLVLTVTCAVNGGSPYAVLAIASVLMVTVYALGGISGAHFNPAVTLAIMISNKMEGGWERGLAYMLSQLVGGCLGAISGFLIYGKAFNIQPSEKFDISHAVVVEFIYTTMLCFTVLCCCCVEGKVTQYYGLAIGFVIVAGGYAAGPISGGALNPAVAFGIDLAGTIQHRFGYSVWYILFQLLGSVAAHLLFRCVHSEQFPEQPSFKIVQKYIAEFIGTFYLVITVGLNVLAGNGLAAFSIAASLMCMIYALGDISGAHFNPAVTLAVCVSRRNKISEVDAVIYIAVQILAGILAGIVYISVWGAGFALGPGAGFDWGAVAVAEIIFTAVLCFVVLHCATADRKEKDIFGLAIGMCVTIGGFAIGNISGASLNPAVSIGLDSAHTIVTKSSFHHGLAYSGLEFVGGLVAVGAFYLTAVDQYRGKK
jgi:aquaporin Z